MELKEKYDLLIHIVNESGLSVKAQNKGVKELFPEFNPLSTKNEKYLTDYTIEMYASSRSLGLSVADAANSAKISATLMGQMLQGVGLSLKRFTDLIEQEIFAVAEMRRKHLAKIDSISDTSNGIAASVAFLEKIYPKQYGPKATITHDFDEDVKKEWKVEICHVDVVKKVEGGE